MIEEARRLRMKGVSVQELAGDPSGVLREAQDRPIAVLGPAGPEAVLVHVRDPLLAEPSVRLALATALYRDRCLSLALAARVAGLGTAEFIQHVSRLGIPVVTGTPSTIAEDLGAIVRWENLGVGT